MSDAPETMELRDAVRDVIARLQDQEGAGTPLLDRVNRALDAHARDRTAPMPLSEQREIMRQVLVKMGPAQTADRRPRQVPPPSSGMRSASSRRRASEAALPLATGISDAAQPATGAPGLEERKEGPQHGALAERVLRDLQKRIDFTTLGGKPLEDQRADIRALVARSCQDLQVSVNQVERDIITGIVLDEMLGLGPLEPLLADDGITDIMVNGAGCIYIERDGQLERTDARFRDDDHVLNVVNRIVSTVGRRVDESSPLVDARLPDGSRVHVVLPPLAVDGPTLTIRKFSRRNITLRDLVGLGTLSERMAQFLALAARMRLNVLISGGTGSGKTTLLNAMSQVIRHDERIVTIEDAAELRLQIPHVVRLETRPANMEARGEVTMRTLLRNALRMRPDRIILGEVRGDEVFDLLQAMNTGHDGSMSTLHANSPRDALTRLENMVAMSGLDLPPEMLRSQVRSSLHLIVQISRMRDGRRRVTSISEVAELNEGVIALQEVFAFAQDESSTQTEVRGGFRFTGYRPRMTERAAEHGLAGDLRQVLEG